MRRGFAGPAPLHFIFGAHCAGYLLVRPLPTTAQVRLHVLLQLPRLMLRATDAGKKRLAFDARSIKQGAAAAAAAAAKERAKKQENSRVVYGSVGRKYNENITKLLRCPRRAVHMLVDIQAEKGAAVAAVVATTA